MELLGFRFSEVTKCFAGADTKTMPYGKDIETSREEKATFNTLTPVSFAKDTGCQA